METQIQKFSIKDALMGNAPIAEVFNNPAIINQIATTRSKFFMENPERSKAIAEREKFHFMKIINDNQQLQLCSKMSLYGCWMDAVALNLSFDPNSKHCYIVPFGKKATLMVSGQGELMLRQQCGQIRYADNPVVVYDCDKYSMKTVDGKLVPNYEQTLLRPKDAKPIAAFIRITRNDGSVDFFQVTAADMDYYRSFSKAPNSDAWTKALVGMYEAKCIKHAFGSYPKIKLLETAKFSSLKSEADETPQAIDYGFDDAEVVEAGPQQEPTPTHFDPQPTPAASFKVDPSAMPDNF